MEGRKFLEDFEAHLSNPEDYLNPSSELKAHCLAGVKTVFDFLQKHCKEAAAQTVRTSAAGKGGPAIPTGPLSELYVEGFDTDQIWEQIQLVNEPMIAYLSKQVEKISKWDLEKLTGGSGMHKAAKIAVSDSDSCSDGTGESESDFDEGDDEMDPANEETNEVRSKRRGNGEGRRTVVDDKFFKLAEMEQFLEKVEREQQQKQGTIALAALACGVSVYMYNVHFFFFLAFL